MSPLPRKTIFRPCAATVGARFGKLEVIEYVEPDGEYGSKAIVRVKCDCGRRISVEARRVTGRPGHRQLLDCGQHGERRGSRVRVGGCRRKPGSMQGLTRPGVMAGGHPSDPDWPIAYVVVAGGKRTEHDEFLEAAAEFRLRSGRKAA